MYINYTNTKCLLFNRTFKKLNINVMINGFKQSESVTYRGVVLDDKSS